jgi:hypothetical protein
MAEVTDAKRTDVLGAAAPDLLSACKELREALAALMRIVARSDYAMIEAWGEDLQRLGIADGFGVRAQYIIDKAEGR